MRLNRLEIAGFKSFPDRSELAFDHGVTAIVGPNGCGKSNVVDAITWVLGEQSAKSLRGDQMQDVIFQGSDARKPTSAAEVRLRLSGVAARVPGNGSVATVRERPMFAAAAVSPVGDVVAIGAVVEAGLAAGVAEPVDDEPLIVRDVELSRRLYRSGESEYLIDGEVVRLKDVQDLLMDAGLGIKAYAVIEQGKIGQILSARPTDRRQLIEEAAGITKYKSRRRAAELKLEAAQQNLTRVDDIIFEVEKQRGALKRQAAKARRYKRLREALRRWEKVQFAQRYRLLGNAIEAARSRLADARARETAAAGHVAEVEATLERLRLELTEADSRTTAAREAAHARELSIGRLQQQVAFDKQQVEILGGAAQRARERRSRPSRHGASRPRRSGRAARRGRPRGRRARSRRGGPRAGRRDLRDCQSDDRRARSGRRGGAQRGLRRGERRDGAAARDGACRRGARAHRRAARQARRRAQRPAGRSAAGDRRARRRRRLAAPRPWRDGNACTWTAPAATRSSPWRASSREALARDVAHARARSRRRGGAPAGRSRSWMRRAPSTAKARG